MVRERGKKQCELKLSNMYNPPHGHQSTINIWENNPRKRNIMCSLYPAIFPKKGSLGKMENERSFSFSEERSV